jgi:hypothetical protein
LKLTFKEYYEVKIQGHKNDSNNYYNINRKKYPKWEGWKVLKENQELSRLEELVQRFYKLEYIKFISN